MLVRSVYSKGNHCMTHLRRTNHQVEVAIVIQASGAIVDPGRKTENQSSTSSRSLIGKGNITRKVMNILQCVNWKIWKKGWRVSDL